MYIWTPGYVQSTPAGTTDGTLTIPTLKPSDFHLVEEKAGETIYRASSADGSLGAVFGTELHVSCSEVNNPYNALTKASKTPANMRIPGLSSRNAYVRVVAAGSATDEDEPGILPDAVAPVTCSVNLGIPMGVQVTTEQLKAQLALAVAALSNIVTSGTVSALSDAVPISIGAVNIL